MSNHYVEYAIRCGDKSATCTDKDDAYRIYSLWVYNLADKREEVILVRIDTQEEVLQSNEWCA